jgi:hypothetical protein
MSADERCRVEGAADGEKGETAMAARTHEHVTAARARSRLDDLLEERRAALESPLAGIELYMADLEAEIESVRATYVLAAVTERALLQGAAHGRNQG